MCNQDFCGLGSRPLTRLSFRRPKDVERNTACHGKGILTPHMALAPYKVGLAAVTITSIKRFEHLLESYDWVILGPRENGVEAIPR